jgi:hypothetical protein
MSLLFKPAGAEHANRYGDSGARSLFIELIDWPSDAPPGWGDLAESDPFGVHGRLAAQALAVYCAFRSREPTLRLQVEELLA